MRHELELASQRRQRSARPKGRFLINESLFFRGAALASSCEIIEAPVCTGLFFTAVCRGAEMVLSGLPMGGGRLSDYGEVMCLQGYVYSGAFG